MEIIYKIYDDQICALTFIIFNKHVKKQNVAFAHLEDKSEVRLIQLLIK